MVFWIWNRVRGKFQWILWIVNLDTTVINDMTIESPRDSQNHRWVEVRYLNRTGVVWMFHSISGSVGSSPWSAWDWFTFLLIIDGRKLGTEIMHASELCLILPQYLRIILFVTERYLITVWIAAVSFLVEDDVPNVWWIWPEEVELVGDTILSR